jgi:flagellar biosynthesis/type III secretory pathway M-ring protein FliF/YscJ
MTKRLALSFALFSAVASSTAFAQWFPPQNGLVGIPFWVWGLVAVVVIAVVVVIIKKRGKK